MEQLKQQINQLVEANLSADALQEYGKTIEAVIDALDTK